MNQLSKWFLCVFTVCSFYTGYANVNPITKPAKVFGISSKQAINNELKPVARQVFDARASRNEFSVHKPFQLIRNNDSFRSGVHQATILQLDGNAIQSMLQNRHDFIELQLEDATGKTWALDLYRSTSVSNDFVVTTSGSDGNPIYLDGGIYYRGVIKGDYSSVAAFSIFDGTVIGMISSEEGNMVLHPMEEEENSFIFYNDRDLKEEMPFSCGTDQLEWSGPDLGEDEEGGSRALTDCVRVYIECDYSLYLNKQSNVTNVVNWITAVYNNVATLYANESINTAISEVFVWTTADPYSKTSASTALNQFRNLRTSFNGDLAHLAALGGNNLGGVAWLNSLCTTYKYAYSNISSTYQNVPTYSWTVMVMTHEMGHNLGSNHTQWCGWVGGALDNCYATEGSCGPGPSPVNGGTIMSYCHLTSNGINLNNGFGTQPGNKIRSRVSAVNCLSASCGSGDGGGGGTCPTPTGLNSSNITSTSATISWTAVIGATSYIFQYKLASSSVWSQTTLTGNIANFTSLTPSTSYNCRVQAVCSGGNSAFSTILTFTTLGAPTCNIPTGLNTLNITVNSATVSWSSVSGALSYNVQYKLSSSSVWTELNTTSTNLTISPLLASTIYNWRVQSVCSSGNSAFSNFLTFTTLSPATCNAPTGLQSSGITTTSVNLNWTAVNGATSYIVEYKLVSSSIWSEQNVSSNNATITSLIPNSAYNWRVRTVCSSNSSPNSLTLNFTTLSVPSCNIPAGLNTSNITSNSVNLSWTAVSGATAYIVEYKLESSGTWSTHNTVTNNTTLTSLIPNSVYNWRVKTVCGSSSSGFSPASNFTTLSIPTCNTPSGLNAFNITANSVNLNWSAVTGASYYVVEYKLSSSGTWIQHTSSGNSTSLSSLLSNSSYDWRVQTVCSGGSSTFSPIFSFTTLGGGPCIAPTNLNSANVTATTASLSWSVVNGAGSYNVEYKLSSESNWNTVTTTTNSVSLAGLSPSSQYHWKVQSVCGGTPSEFSFQSLFRTSVGGGSCGTPEGLSSSNVTASSATVSWNAVSGAITYNVEYKLSSANTWTLVNVAGTNTTLNSLASNSAYNVKVQAICNGSSGSYSIILNFTTLNPSPECNSPGGLSVSNITVNSANVSWSAVSGAVSYNVEYKLASSGTWSSSNVQGTSTNLSSLNSNSTYNVRVQTVCNESNSPFSITVNFTTLNSDNTCNAPVGLNSTNVTSDQAQVNWSAVSGAVSYVLEYKLAAASVWIPVNVTGTSHLLISLTSNSTYNYRVRTVCPSGISAFSTTSNFTTQQEQGATGYCSSSGENASIEWISRFSIGTINRISGSDGGYFDATSMSSGVPRGRSQTLIHRSNFSGAPRTLYWRVWVDLNQDGDFDDAGELLVSKISDSDNDQYSSFLIPFSALLGPTRLRIQAKYNSYGGPCETFPNGEVEDFTIEITNLYGLPSAGDDSEISIINDIKMYPNPVSEDLNISFQALQNSNIHLQIVDLFGRVLKQEEYFAQEGDNKLAITVSDLLSGPYVLILKNGSLIKNYRFIKSE